MKTKSLLFASALLVLSIFVLGIRSDAYDGRVETITPSHTDDKEKDKARKTPQDGEEWFGLAYELHNSERYPEAIAAFKKAIELDYRKATAMYNVACGYALLNDTESALSALKQSLENGFSSTDLFFDDSDLDSLRSNPKFRALLTAVSPTNKETPLDRLEENLQKFERLQQTSSQNGEEWYLVGKRFVRFRDTDRAIVALRQATSFLGYRNESALYKLGSAYALKGNRDVAFEWLEKAIDAGYDGTLAKDQDLASLSADSRFKAIEEKSRILTMSQFFKDNDDNSARSKRVWASAADFYQSYLQREPGSGRGWFNLGYALHYSSEHGRAIAAFDRALSLGYRTPTSMYNLACANAMLGHTDVALEWLKKSHAAGFDIDHYLDSDRDLDALRSDPRFKSFQQRVSTNFKNRK